MTARSLILTRFSLGIKNEGNMLMNLKLGRGAMYSIT